MTDPNPRPKRKHKGQPKEPFIICTGIGIALQVALVIVATLVMGILGSFMPDPFAAIVIIALTALAFATAIIWMYAR